MSIQKKSLKKRKRKGVVKVGKREKRRRKEVEYRRTFNGMLSRMYYYMRRRVLKGGGNRGYLYIGKHILSRQDFYDFAKNSKKLKQLYREWKKYDFILSLRPTPDRIDSEKGYEVKNLDFVTYSENASFGVQNKA